MKKSIFIFLLFLLQLLLCFFGVDIFGYYINPFLFFFASVFIAVLYFRAIIGHQDARTAAFSRSASDRVYLLIMLLSLTVFFVLYFFLFQKYNGTYIWSDVIPQLDALYDRFVRGEQPYYPVNPPSHSPFPVYMPLHWLPIGLARLSGIDLRFIGLFILFTMICVYGFYSINRFDTQSGKIMLLAMPVVVLLFFYNRFDLVFVFETPIAAYYLLLALGLSFRNVWMTTIGIIFCLLSRYTMVFWLPLFAVLLWFNAPRRQNIMVWGSVAIAVLMLYIIPFYLRAPSILQDGVRYHNNTVIGGWAIGSYTIFYGFYFAPHMRDLFSGDMAHRVYCARIVQASAMLILFFGGLFAYFRIRAKVNFYDFSLGMLYLVLLCFYTIGPLTFRYYLISLFFVTVVLCAKILEYREPGTR